MVTTAMNKEKVWLLIEAIAALGYPVGMGIGPHPKDAEKILRILRMTLPEPPKHP
jgi:hypothetical protein